MKKNNELSGYLRAAMALPICAVIALQCAACNVNGDDEIIYYDTCTVSFDANGGSGTVPALTVPAGYDITLPDDGSRLSKDGAAFGGWNTDGSGTGTAYPAGSSFRPGGNITLYADWVDSIESVTSLAEKLDWLKTYAQTGGNYPIVLNADESIDTHELFYDVYYYDDGYKVHYEKSNITITLKSSGANRTLSLLSNGPLFIVHSGVTLILDENITLQGHSANTDSLVRVFSGGTLRMNNGSAVTGNAASFGGGVYINNGAFTMDGGTISGNTASSGGGVYVNGGSFTMNGGTIVGNTASFNGGGVGVAGSGTFIMSEGSISGNIASSGGGVHMYRGIFIKTGGIIYGTNSNTAKSIGNAVYVYVNTSDDKRREETAGPEVNLSFDYNKGSPLFSDGWDN